MKTQHLPVQSTCSINGWKQFLPALSGILIFFITNAAFAQLPTGFVAKKLTTNNIKEAVTMAHAPDGRIFIAERSGALKQLKDGVVTTILTVTTTDAAEQGLLGIALHTNFATNGKLYLYYTDPAITKHYLDVIVLSATSTITSNTRLMEFDPIINGYHNGGAMQFKDGLLYICIGESNAPENAPLLTTYRGKVLRLQDDGTPAPGNPYYNTAGAGRQQKSIWAIGMRNPWYMTMDPQTKKLFNINVGGGYEEINDITAPDATRNYNYGWGTDNRAGPEQNAATTILPVFAYNRNVANWNSQTCAITTGCAFNPTLTNYPAEYRNRLYFSDWCTNWLRSIDLNNPSSGTWNEFSSTGFGRVLGLTVGIDGNLYYSEYTGNGNIWRIEYTLTQTPQIVNQPDAQTVYATESVSFSVSASGSNPITYQWKKNGNIINGATSSTFTINNVTTGDGADYTVVVTNSVASITSDVAKLTVKPYNAPPVAKITTPLNTLKWSVDNIISYSGTGTDTEDGTLGAAAFNWEVRVHHKDCPTCEHWHPGPAAADGVKSGTFTAINGGETSSNIWLRVILTVTDKDGRTGVDSVDIQPNKVDLKAVTNIPGLELVIGLGATTPYTKTAVVNANIDLQAPTPQVVGSTVYSFTSWNHGGPANQVIRVPTVGTTYTANYSSAIIGNNNLALNKPATASSVVGGNTAAKAVDGNVNQNRWESASSDPQWIYVDLGDVYTITRVKITWEPAYGKDYRIEVSNDINNWGTPVKNVVGNTSVNNEWTSLTAVGRYIRIYGTARGTVYGYSIYELEVYGALAPKDVVTGITVVGPAINGSLFPNPVTQEVTVTGTFKTSQNVNVTLLDANGYVVFDKDYANTTDTFKATINVADLASGIYVVKMIAGNGEVLTQKMVKQ